MTTDERASPQPSIRPTAIFVAFFVGALILDRLIPQVRPAAAMTAWQMWFGAAVVLLGAAVTMICFLMFGRVGTGIMPGRPARQLVTHGPYAWSRNPMFVGFSCIYGGAALLAGSIWALLLLPAATAVTTAAVIRDEEAYLRLAFGEQFEAYARSVNRWLGRRRVVRAGRDVPVRGTPVGFGDQAIDEM